jgi:hypothetical protein
MPAQLPVRLSPPSRGTVVLLPVEIALTEAQRNKFPSARYVLRWVPPRDRRRTQQREAELDYLSLFMALRPKARLGTDV